MQHRQHNQQQYFNYVCTIYYSIQSRGMTERNNSDKKLKEVWTYLAGGAQTSSDQNQIVVDVCSLHSRLQFSLSFSH